MSRMDDERLASVVRKRMEEIIHGEPNYSTDKDKTALIARKFRFKRVEIRDFLK